MPTSPRAAAFVRRTSILFVTLAAAAALAAPRVAGAQRYARAAATAIRGAGPASPPALRLPAAKRRVLAAPLIGMIVGAAAGGALGAAIAQGACERPRCGEWQRGLAAGAAIGAVIGVSFGVIVSRASLRDWP